jgi:hypothetical protein
MHTLAGDDTLQINPYYLQTDTVTQQLTVTTSVRAEIVAVRCYSHLEFEKYQ